MLKKTDDLVLEGVPKEDDDDGPPEGDTIIISLVEIESDWREHWNIA